MRSTVNISKSIFRRVKLKINLKNLHPCLYIPNMRIPLSTATTAPTLILLWAAASRWRSVEDLMLHEFLLVEGSGPS